MRVRPGFEPDEEMEAAEFDPRQAWVYSSLKLDDDLILEVLRYPDEYPEDWHEVAKELRNDNYHAAHQLESRLFDQIKELMRPYRVLDEGHDNYEHLIFKISVNEEGEAERIFDLVNGLSDRLSSPFGMIERPTFYPRGVNGPHVVDEANMHELEFSDWLTYWTPEASLTGEWRGKTFYPRARL